MRRELLFSLAGFLGGFVVAAFVFWTPAAIPLEGTDTNAGKGTSGSLRESTVAAIPEGRRPLVVAAGEGGSIEAPGPATTPEAKAPAEIFHEAIGSLKGLDAGKRQAAVEALVRRLRAAGPEGLKVLRDYFSAGQDVKFQNGYAKVDGQYVMVPTLRASLLVALQGWDGPEAVELTREILRSTPRLSEASLAIAQLEKRAPGVYRAEAIQTLLELATATGTEDKDAWMNGSNGLISAMVTFKAPELQPAAEALVTKNPWLATQYLNALNSLPADVRSAALGRFFANEALAKNFTANPWSLGAMNYGEPVVAQNVARIFSSSTDKKFRENFLMNFASSGMWSASGNAAQPSTAEKVARYQQKLLFLEQIRPYANTPVLQERWQDAAAAVQVAIANPDKAQIGAMRAQTGGGATIIQSGGSGTVQFIEVNPSK